MKGVRICSSKSRMRTDVKVKAPEDRLDADPRANIQHYEDNNFGSGGIL